MLTKLLQYEYKTTARTLVPIGLGVLGLSLLSGLLSRLLEPVPDLPAALDWTQGLLAGAVVLALVFVLAACFFVNVQRFYRLLGDQGYLMLSLPVPVWQHIAAKLLCACSWAVIAFLYLFLCVDLLAGELPRFHIAWPGMTPAAVVQLILLMFMLLLLVAVSYLQFYLCCAIGAQFGQQRLLASIITYFVLGFVEQILFALLVFITAFGAVQSQSVWTGFFRTLENDPAMAGTLMLAGINVFLLLVAAVHWAVIQWLMTRRLNLA
ncbi:hypothetical protein [uncultured Subdoligranulum sp.]|uniref:hypothetical protein n=1 Tax=uncultured Subdoligranulum sp. TaxID=512298 RepID=UPI0025E80200|nr:hypothetical protein [uncultured Subdoligranulum sp.]